MDFGLSYRKTTALAGVAFLGGLAVAGAAIRILPPGFGVAVAWVITLLALMAGLVFASGLLVLHRYARVQRGQPDLYLALSASRREAPLAEASGFRAGFLRRLLARPLLGHSFLVGDEVEIRPAAEIMATLDAQGTLEGIPFQPEMLPLCGKRLRVFRSVDKIYDYGRTKRMRRLERSVLLSGLRCDGADHGGCQALCYFIWKTEWLRPAGGPAPSANAASTAAISLPPTFHDDVQPDKVTRRYVCQYTQLHSATVPIGAWDLFKDLRPLVAGNVTLGTFLVGMGTRLFNRVQELRRGNGFPFMPFPPDKPQAGAATPLAVGAQVKVRPIQEIVVTLNRTFRNKGLWFDRDMVKHCGVTLPVLARVDRIIDDSNGEMREMKTPCILLERCDYSGEFLNFSAQHDPFFWREAWLEPVQQR